MAKKSNKKPGKTNTSLLAMKKRKSNLNQSKMTKVIVILMILAFIVPIVGGLILYLVFL